MCARPKRGLKPEEKELWHLVTERIAPLHRPRQTAEQAGAEFGTDPRAEPGPPQIPNADPPHLKPFQITGPARAGHATWDLAPTPAEQLAKAPLRMDRKAFTRMNRGKLAPEARIDLHGMTLAAAHPALIGFVLRSQAAGRRLILVITGKGRPGPDDGPIPQRPGILKHQVPQWLASAPLSPVVLQVTEAHRRHGGSGAYYVYLRRRE